MEVYADYAATTPVDARVIAIMTDVLTNEFGNASSIHKVGRSTRAILDNARREMASLLNASPKEIIMTSGATESNNTAIKGVVLNHPAGKHIITTQIEHHSVLYVFQYLESIGYNVTYLPVNEFGEVQINDVKEALRDDTVLVSIMFGNNEVGSIQPIEEIGELLKYHDALFHVDAVQAFGHIRIDVTTLNVDLLSLSAHKFYGPKGTGLLYIKDKTKLNIQQLGGSQETKRRAGTENIPSIKAMSFAMTLATEEMNERNIKLLQLKEHFLNGLHEANIPFELNGNKNMQLSHINNIYFPFLNVETFLTLLDMNGVYVSSGSACTAGSVEPSHVLTAMYGESQKTTHSIRFAFSHLMTTEQIDYIVQTIKTIYETTIK